MASTPPIYAYGVPCRVVHACKKTTLYLHYVQQQYGIFDTEAATKTGMVMVFGEITTNANVDYQKVVRKTVQEIGYNDSKIGKLSL